MKTKLLLALLSSAGFAAHGAIVVQAHYEMGDNGAGSNSLPVDSSGNGRDMTNAIGAPTISLSGGGYNDDAYTSLSANNAFYGNGGYDAPEDNVGIEVWARTSNLTQTNTHLFGTGSNVTGLNLGFDAAGSRGWFGAIGGVAYVGAQGLANYTVGDWVHLAVVRAGGTTTFYVNGVASGTATDTPNDANGSGPGELHLGVTSGGTAYFEGDLAEARIFTFNAGEFETSDLLFPAVPEPSIALLGGLGLLGLLRRRR